MIGKVSLYLTLSLVIQFISANEDVQCYKIQKAFQLCKINNTLIYVNETISDETQLQIMDSDIDTITPNAFQNLSIEVLTLNFTGNQMIVEPKSFEGLQNVSVLVINSAIISLEPNLFEALTFLHILSISFGQIVEVKKRAFAGPSNVTLIEVSYTNLSTINKDTFDGVHGGVKCLFLNNNKISNIETKSFTMFPKLQALQLSENQLTDIQPGTFDGLEGLDTLLLNHNRITAVRTNVFNQIHQHLDHLDLSYNSINHIEAGAFNLLSLTLLNLRNNQLSVVSAGSFEGLWTNGLNLAHNNIVGVEDKAFDQMNNITIFFKGNNVTVDKDKWGLGEFSDVRDEDFGPLKWL